MKQMRMLASLFGVALVILYSAVALSAEQPSADSLERVKEKLVAPPAVPVHTQEAKGPPVIVRIRLVVEEKRMQVSSDGANIWALTFNGTVPGPLIVAHQNDYVELTLVNPGTNTLVHNIDFHAATGALGGGAMTHVAPGQEVVLRFKLIKSGVFVYHCEPGGVMTPLHVASGMNGAIMVLPRDGLRDAQGKKIHYDRAFYIGEQDFYLPKDEKGAYNSYVTPAAGFGNMMEVMKTLTPTFEVFNGSVGALTGEHALKARVGEKVLFIHSQANRDTRIHLIGGQGDLVWRGGSFADPPATNLETWAVPGGSAIAMLYEFRQPGTYMYLNHNLIEAMLLGAAAEVEVEGAWNEDIMKQIKKPGPIGEH
ncbi:Copper-containing nitrite reductase [Candidatus Methylobacter favarea]|uniref:Copper-containing nitrite reductase n=1 Tax=Candidatus Methylobacter favarea TaxID=2707345 RepID=A0A8S0XW88_9GAMM|nr:copper-containing nitrite reductase [Candidatus Methylobacter favarea]CAA9893058.1 Copper-containing nitrite reductase [Candidatus Methylobacter favarea]